jgi:hypothetical protein
MSSENATVIHPWDAARLDGSLLIIGEFVAYDSLPNQELNHGSADST